MKEEKDKQNRQQLACDFIFNNYVSYRRLRYDTIAQKVQVCDVQDVSFGNEKWRYITNADINTMVCDCCMETGASITAREILTVLNAGSTYIPHVHPLRDYVRSVCPYTEDQPDWIDMVAQQVKVRNSTQDSGMLDVGPSDSESSEQSETDNLWRVCFKKWFVAMVASWLYDNVVNHQVLVLIGRQGIFKTTWLENLIPPHLRDYCCKLANATQLSKDDRLRIAEFGLINMDELDAMTPRELNAMKSIITAADVNERAAYGYTKERRVRLASFCASSNRREFLTDITGNRRWLPFEVESIQSPFHTILPYDYMYAQALYLIEHGFNYWFDLDEINSMETHNEAFRSQENEEQLLPLLFDIPAEGKGEFMTTAQISEHIVSYGNIKKPISVAQLGMLLGKAGYQPVRRKINASKVRGWLVYQRDSEEITSLKRLLKE